MGLTVHLPGPEKKARLLKSLSYIISSSIFPVFPHVFTFCPSQHSNIPSGRPNRIWGSVDDYRNNLFPNGS